MGKMRKRSLICLLLILAMTMGACGKKETSAPTPSPDSGTEVEADGKEEATEDDSWLAQAKLDETETVEELYEKAKEEGKVVIYATSSRIKAVKETFEEEYPGIEIEFNEMRPSEIFEKIEREHTAGIHNADLIFSKDTNGVVYNEFFKRGVLHSYMPEDIMENMSDEYKTVAYKPYFEVKQMFYNTEVYDESPLTSWWDLTKPEYKGRIMINNPLANETMMALFISMIQHADEMAEDYEQVFGEKIVLNGTENAGYEYMKRLAENDPILTTSDGDIVKAIGAPGQDTPPFGIAVSTKMREVEKSGLLIDVVKNPTPRDGVAGLLILPIVDQAKNVNAAKLLIRWMAGETDGTGKGFDPFRVTGTWPTRTDIETPGDTQPLEELNLWPEDADFNYKTFEDATNFWISLQ